MVQLMKLEKVVSLSSKKQEITPLPFFPDYQRQIAYPVSWKHKDRKSFQDFPSPATVPISQIYQEFKSTKDETSLVRQNYVAEKGEDEEISVNAREKVVILNDKLPKFWLVKTQNDQIGLINAISFAGHWGKKIGEGFWSNNEASKEYLQPNIPPPLPPLP
jgi:hypothetical protein